MSNPYSIIINFLVIIFLLLAFLTAQWKGKLALLAITALLFGLPYVFPQPEINWIYNTGKVLLGLGCYLYVRRQGYL